jgi:hypothetical protein
MKRRPRVCMLIRNMNRCIFVSFSPPLFDPYATTGTLFLGGEESNYLSDTLGYLTVFKTQSGLSFADGDQGTISPS